jgi:hypothetical protein
MLLITVNQNFSSKYEKTEFACDVHWNILWSKLFSDKIWDVLPTYIRSINKTDPWEAYFRLMYVGDCQVRPSLAHILPKDKEQWLDPFVLSVDFPEHLVDSSPLKLIDRVCDESS